MDRQRIDERLEKIEMKLAFLEDFLLRLQEETLAIRAVQDRMETERQAMKERLIQISQELEVEPHDRKPPHY